MISYNRGSAVLTLEHNFPIGNGIKACVDVQLLLNSLTHHETRVGEWVNVVGYVANTDEPQDIKTRKLETDIAIQAIALWSSGPIQLDAYERSLTP